MFHWIAVKFRKDSSTIHPAQTTYQALLSSTVADADVVTDWIYFVDIFRNDQDIPQWLLTLQLISCIFGTISWLSVATDGRLVYWVKVAILYPIIILFYIIFVPIYILKHWIFRKCLGDFDSEVYNFFMTWVNGLNLM